MKKILFTFYFSFVITALVAQKQTNIWYFGTKAGLDFNTVPPKALTNGKAGSVEGSSTVSDNNGKLLFYTNGTVIMNKQHLIMLNGNNLFGDISSTNNTLIVPLPGNDSIYYVFTTGAALQETHEFRYSIVNIKGDGGLGEVINKNIFIEDLIFEKLAGVRHCNNRDVWVVVHKWDSDEYHSYLVTASGLSLTPVNSNTGLVITGYENNAIGTLKFSSKGNSLAAVHAFQNDAVELMDFDNTTGVLSNPIVFHPNSIPKAISFIGVYGAEFSPNGKLLYISSNTSSAVPCILYQFDITSHNAATIISTKKIIAQTTPWFAGALQTGPDLKIYMAMWQDDGVSVIHNPDVYGPGCNFRFNDILMGPGAGSEPIQFGLPTFIQSYFDTTANPYDFSRTGTCTDHMISFSINRLSGIDSVKWFFGDGNQSQLLAPTNNYINPGFYNVKLIVYKVDCSGLNDTIKRTIWITDQKQFLGNDTSSCSNLQILLGINDINGANYLWNTGSVSNFIVSNNPGLYWMEIQQNGCTMRDSVNIFLKPPPIVNVGKDTTVCTNQGIVLNSGNATASNYLWNTGEITQSIFVKKVGEYSVTVTENSCIAADTVKVNWGDCDVFIPTAFTPNNDGLNDNFGIINGFTVKNFLLQIFDKWGQPVFSTSEISQKWDGTYKKAKMPNGAYLWILHYVNSKNERKYLNGTVILIR